MDIVKKGDRLKASTINNMVDNINRIYTPITKDGVTIAGSPETGLSINISSGIEYQQSCIVGRAHNLSASVAIGQFRPCCIKGMFGATNYQDIVSKMTLNVELVSASTSSGIICVALEPIPANGVGRVCITGICPCWLAGTTYVSGTNLGYVAKSGVIGAMPGNYLLAKVIYCPTSTSDQIGIIKI